MEQYGWNNLSDIELLSIVTGNDTSAQALMNYFVENDTFSVEGITKLGIDGIGKTTASKIKALSTFFSRKRLQNRVAVTKSETVYAYMRDTLYGLEHEEFWVCLLDTSLHILKKVKLSQGGMNSCIVDIRLLIKQVLNTARCCAIVLVHNHPSKNHSPSKEDEVITKRIVNACNLFDIKVIDHLIVTDDGYYSFVDNGKL